ncbi:protein kinase domain-containing protein [Actinomyces gerencseriae]|uniref:protein kinase domain-containing protein n=1 Tax=Actinomyces gerencseriae TaxID=52769 RepID=UPI00040E1EAE|nr:protein kinase [Actinomyces gerencseriae]
MRSLKPRRSKSEPPRAGDSSSTEDTALPVEISDELVAAGLAIGEPMGRDRPGYFAPRRALDTSGRDVVVQVVDVAEGAAGARALRRLADLRLLRSEAIVGVRQVISLPGGRVGVISDLVVGADLAVVLGARGGLTRDEAARLLDDLGAALAHLHERSMAHGDVAAANVIVDTDGRPVLIDLLGGVLETGTESSAAPERGTGGPATAAADVYSLAALLRQCAAGSPALAERLDRVLLDALDPDPARRPSARDLAARAPEIGRPGAIELPDGARLAAGALRAATAQPTRAVASRRGRAPGARRPARPRGLTGPPASHRRRAALLGLVLLMLSAVVVAVGAGALMPGWAPDRILGRDDAPSTAEASASTMAAEAVAQDAADADAADAVAMDAADAGETDMLPVVVELSVTRDAALNEGDAEALASTTAPGSPAALADQALLTALADAGERVEGLDTMVHSVTSAQAERAGDDWPGATVVRVSQSQGPSVRIGADGSRRAVPAQASRDVVLVLVPDPWRVVEVLQAD